MSDPVEKKLYYAAGDGRGSEVSSLLKDHPEINVNWTNQSYDQWSPLHLASALGHVEVVKRLLAHPNINVNLKNSDERTPLSYGCWIGQVSVVEVLLKDPRVNVALDDNNGRTPLWHASWFGHHEVIEWLIACGKDIGIENKKGKAFGQDYTVLEIARERGKTEVMSLLERFIADPALTRHELRVKLGVLDVLLTSWP